MTKLELIDRIYRTRGLAHGMTKRAVTDVIDGVFAELGEYFVQARLTRRGPAPKFTYPGFGTFSKRQRPEREGRHPQTGMAIVIPAANTLAFSPGGDLKDQMNSR